jgi:predicted nucleotidyltransferase component of viral defense system
MADKYLRGFYLAGGTAIALRLGHRYSLDLDLFTTAPFPVEALQRHLSQTYRFRADFTDSNTLLGTIANVKTDFIAHQYPMLEAYDSQYEIRIASLSDLAAMKLNAIVNDGSRMKDYADVAAIGTQMSLHSMVNAYTQKYAGTNPLMALKSLAYFEAVNKHERLTDLESKPINWAVVKDAIIEMINSPEIRLKRSFQ